MGGCGPLLRPELPGCSPWASEAVVFARSFVALLGLLLFWSSVWVAIDDCLFRHDRSFARNGWLLGAGMAAQLVLGTCLFESGMANADVRPALEKRNSVSLSPRRPDNSSFSHTLSVCMWRFLRRSFSRASSRRGGDPPTQSASSPVSCLASWHGWVCMS
jgi:hypothetical protein